MGMESPSSGTPKPEVEKEADKTMEEGPEKFPSREELDGKFVELLGGEKYRSKREGKIETNAEGEITRYDIVFVLENGDEREYNFQRAEYDYSEAALRAKGANDAQIRNLRFSASIHKTSMDGDSYPGCVANYLDGEWSTPE